MWPDRIIRFGFYLLVILVPLVLTPWNYELFEYNKMLVVYGLTAIITAAWCTKMILAGEIKIAKTPLDIPIALFLLSQLVSTIFSIDHHVSWWGYYSRFNGGMWSIFSYVLLYYAFVSNREILNSIKLLKVLVATGTIVAVYGVAERLGIDKNLWVQDVQNRVFSTLGQPNWLAAYLSALAPIAIAMGMLNAKWPMINRKSLFPSLFSIWHLALAILFFTVILFTRSRSGLLGFAVSDGLFWLLAATFARGGLAKLFFVFHVALFIIILVNGTHIDQIDKYFIKTPPAAVATPSGTLLETGGTESGTIRKYVWQAAVTAWQSTTKTKLIGTGTETFAFAFYQFRPKEHNLTSEWDFLYNKAHNEYLNYLATTGAFGLGAYLLIIAAFSYWFVRQKKDAIMIAVFSGWLSILVTNFFGFSVVIMNFLLFLLPAVMIAQNLKADQKLISVPSSQKGLLQGAVVTVAVIILAILVRDWYADSLYATGYHESHAGSFALANRHISTAISLHPTEPNYHDEESSVLSSLALAASESKEATVASEFMKQSLAESDLALATSPNNVNFWKTRTKVYYSLSSLDPKFNANAIEALEKARSLSPNDSKITYNLAILRGRQAENDAAIELLKQTIGLKPNYRDAYFALYLFYKETGRSDLAVQTVQNYLDKVDPKDPEFLQKVGR